MIDVIADALMKAVRDTLTEGSPEPARTTIARLALADDEAVGSDGPQPCWTMAFLTLARWMDVTRTELADRPDRAGEVLSWIEATLGRRCCARARYTVPALESQTAMEETVAYAEGLGEDYLPTMIWIMAAVAARYGDGDPDWLLRLDVRSSPAAGDA